MGDEVSDGLKKARILVVDDISENLRVVGTMLRNDGFAVAIAQSGQQALKQVEAQLPDLILLDLMMPEMDGFDVFRKLKQDERYLDIPVIFLTASSEIPDMVKAFEMGAVDYVTKPFKEVVVLARVRTHVELKYSKDRLVNANHKLRELVNDKNEFIGMASHELRSPLSSIMGILQIMMEDEETSKEQIEDDLNVMFAASEQMLNLINNLLNVNLMDEGKLIVNSDIVNLNEVVASTVQTYSNRAEAKEQKILIETDGELEPVYVDPILLMQVIGNLITNAVKFSPKGTTISVRVKRKAGNVVCEIADEGPGFTKEDFGKIFQKFSKLSARPTARESSNGLGLSIVKRLTEVMNGTVECESESVKGATFTLSFPRAKTN
tara:strand:+ start:674 stop:1810 length:1137 start_codon:yes stop_codon:yes gene_type:complete